MCDDHGLIFVFAQFSLTLSSLGGAGLGSGVARLWSLHRAVRDQVTEEATFTLSASTHTQSTSVLDSLHTTREK